MVPSSVGDKSSSVEESRPGGSSVDVFIALMRNTERVLRLIWRYIREETWWSRIPFREVLWNEEAGMMGVRRPPCT